MTTIEICLTDRGYLRLPADAARRFFPHDLLAVLPGERELWLLPTRGPGAGGLILTQRNPAGDRSVLVHHLLPADVAPGIKRASWDEVRGALKVALDGM